MSCNWQIGDDTKAVALLVPQEDGTTGVVITGHGFLLTILILVVYGIGRSTANIATNRPK